MPAESDVPHDLAVLVRELLDAAAERVVGPLAELAGLLAEPNPVRVVPSDRWTPWTFAVPATPDRILGQQLDRARVVIRNVGPETVALGADESLTAAGSNRLDIDPGAALTLDTRAEIYAVSPTGAGLLAVIVEEWDT